MNSTGFKFNRLKSLYLTKLRDKRSKKRKRINNILSHRDKYISDMASKGESLGMKAGLATTLGAGLATGVALAPVGGSLALPIVLAGAGGYTANGNWGSILGRSLAKKYAVNRLRHFDKLKMRDKLREYKRTSKKLNKKNKPKKKLRYLRLFKRHRK